MPELPEVEVIRRELSAVILGRVISEVNFRRENLRYELPFALIDCLDGCRFTEIERRGKYLIMRSDGDYCMLSHLGMSGNYLFYENSSDADESLKHRHVDIYFEDGSVLTYSDPRRFGFIDFCMRGELNSSRHFCGMGVEPLSNNFHGAYLHEKCCESTKSIKALLLEQSVIAGIGNIYACEALWLSSISPLRKANTVSKKNYNMLAENIVKTLVRAINKGGSSLRNFHNLDGESGYFQHEWLCYGREGDSCSWTNCTGVIKRIKQHGRSSFYCTKHQK